MIFRPPGECPVCGDEVPGGAKACPACGACEHSGWNDEADETDDFDYEEFVQEEFGSPSGVRIHPLWWVAGVIVLVAFATRMFGLW